MLTHICIQGLAVIESLEVDFDDGFNVITGETGAGKSILIKALSLLFGGKASAETVRKGSNEASICAQFHIYADHSVRSLLESLGLSLSIDSNDEFSLLVRRKITPKGRSQAWVNDIAVTLQSLQKIGENLIDVFAQHESHKLLDPREHLLYLDAFLKDKTLLKIYQDQYHECQERLAALCEFVEQTLSNQREKDYLQFRFQELSDFSPSEDDYTQILKISQDSAIAFASQSHLKAAQVILDEGASGDSLARAFSELSRELRALCSKDEKAANLVESAEQISSLINDLSFELSRFGETPEVSEQLLEEAQSRLSAYQNLFRKFAVSTIEELMVQFEKLSTELSSLDEAEIKIRAELKVLKGLCSKLSDQAKALSAARIDAMTQMKKKIEKELRDLAMPAARIEVQLLSVQRPAAELRLSSFSEESQMLFSEISSTLSSLSENGAERIQILFSANAGEDLFALQKIASGGEVSRIMLALKRALSAGAQSCLLVFDEIDTGISGKVADVVGIKLKELSKNFQVLCISHLAQVAAYADTHFLVKKEGKNARTESQIIRLSKKDSLEELARLLSGNEITKQSLANARILVDRAHTQSS